MILSLPFLSQILWSAITILGSHFLFTKLLVTVQIIFNCLRVIQMSLFFLFFKKDLKINEGDQLSDISTVAVNSIKQIWQILNKNPSSSPSTIKVLLCWTWRSPLQYCLHCIVQSKLFVSWRIVNSHSNKQILNKNTVLVSQRLKLSFAELHVKTRSIQEKIARSMMAALLLNFTILSSLYCSLLYNPNHLFRDALLSSRGMN